jgi:hypothetical protein
LVYKDGRTAPQLILFLIGGATAPQLILFLIGGATAPQLILFLIGGATMRKRLSSCCKLFMNTEIASKKILDYLMATISYRSVPDCEYRYWLLSKITLS